MYKDVIINTTELGKRNNLIPSYYITCSLAATSADFSLSSSFFPFPIVALATDPLFTDICFHFRLPLLLLLRRKKSGKKLSLPFFFCLSSPYIPSSSTSIAVDSNVELDSVLESRSSKRGEMLTHIYQFKITAHKLSCSPDVKQTEAGFLSVFTQK